MDSGSPFSRGPVASSRSRAHMRQSNVTLTSARPWRQRTHLACTLNPNLVGVGGEHAHISIGTHRRLPDAMRSQSRTTEQGSDIMKKLALATSMLTLMTISAPAFAETAAFSGRQAVSSASAFGNSLATDTDAAYHYHGGPKFND